MSSARSVTSRRLPSGVATTYNVLASALTASRVRAATGGGVSAAATTLYVAATPLGSRRDVPLRALDILASVDAIDARMSSARSVTSRRLPSGVATTYNVLASALTASP